MVDSLALARAWSMLIPPWHHWAMVAAISNSIGTLLTGLELFIAFWKIVWRTGHSSPTKLLMMVHKGRRC